jgi:hypothetical protein
MNVPDTDLVRLLTERDGPLPERSWPHVSEDRCRYSEMYEGRECPWCAAARRRSQREAAGQTP